MTTTTTITTAAELEALPDGSVVLDRAGDAWQRRGLDWCTTEPDELSLATSEVASHWGPLTLLRRPDAPQPAVDEDPVERAARAICRRIHRSFWPVESAPSDRKPCVHCMEHARAALDAARGDGAPSVTAEQVDEAVRVMMQPRMHTNASGDARREDLVAALAALGIEVRS